MRVRTFAVIPLACAAVDACGEALAPPDDEAPSTADASVPTSVCDRARPFGAPTDVPVDGAYSIEAARFNDGRTVAYLALCPADGNKVECNLFQSPFNGTQFGTHTKIPVSTEGRYDSYPTITSDGRFLVFASRRDVGLRVMVAAAINATFEGVAPSEQAFAPSLQQANEPYVLGSGKALYFGGAQGDLDWEIYKTTAWGGDAAAPVVRLAELGTRANENAPVVSDDEQEIFFASNRAKPSDATNGFDIYRALRAPGDATFGPAELEAALSGAGNDWPVWISPDRCDLYFINKDPTTQVATLRVATRR